MAETGISWGRRLRWGFNVLRDYLATNLENADSQLVLHQKLTAVLQASFGPELSRLRILEIGCGQRASQTILFTADGFETIGIDLEVPTFRMTGKEFLQILKRDGWERAFKSFLRHCLFDAHFFRRLSARYGRRLPPDRVDVRLMNAAQLEFPDDYFDFIYSSMVFEHIDDVPGAAREVNRVLRPQGRAWINVHLFPSLSGGHHPEWNHRRGFSHFNCPPWDHLLENKFPAHSYLNKLRRADYQKIFNEFLEVEEERPALELTDLLTPELEKELLAKGYSREELLTREVAFFCRKKAGA